MLCYWLSIVTLRTRFPGQMERFPGQMDSLDCCREQCRICAGGWGVGMRCATPPSLFIKFVSIAILLGI